MEIGKNRVFIGSSSEAIKYAYALQSIMDSDCEITVWDQDIFKPSRTAIESLVEGLGNFDFAVFIMSSDDKVISRGREYDCTRDNIIFEIGLFIGRLGRDRVFMLKPSQKDIKIPSDLLGVYICEYNDERTDGNDVAAMGNIKYKLNNRMKQVRDLTSEPEEVALAKLQLLRQPADRAWEAVFARQKLSAVKCIHDTFHDVCWILHLDIDKPKSIRTIYGDEIFVSVVDKCKELVNDYCKRKFHAKKWKMLNLCLHENSILILVEKMKQESRLKNTANQIAHLIHEYDWDEPGAGIVCVLQYRDCRFPRI